MKVLVPLLSLFAGVIIGGTFFGEDSFQKTSFGTNQDGGTLSELQNKLQDLHDVDIKEYLSLKDQKAQFIKANEILSKMMVIFLADLGLRVGSTELDQLKGLAEQSLLETEACGEGSGASGESKASSSQEGKEELSISEEMNHAKKLIAEQDKWKKSEKKVESISTDSEIEEFLKEVEIKNLFDEVSTAKVINEGQFKKISGTFEGVLVYSEKSQAPADVTLELDAIFKDGKIDGTNKVTMSRDGKKFNNSNSNGDDLKDFKANSDTQAIFVSLGGRSGYIQLYSVRGGSVLVGNYYKQDSMVKFTRAGTVTLYRR